MTWLLFEDQRSRSQQAIEVATVSTRHIKVHVLVLCLERDPWEWLAHDGSQWQSTETYSEHWTWPREFTHQSHPLLNHQLTCNWLVLPQRLLSDTHVVCKGIKVQYVKWKDKIFMCDLILLWLDFITGPLNGPVFFCWLASVVYCRL